MSIKVSRAAGKLQIVQFQLLQQTCANLVQLIGIWIGLVTMSASCTAQIHSDQKGIFLQREQLISGRTSLGMW